MTAAKGGYVYILASQRNGTLYVGVTSNLLQRGDQHIAGTTGSFTQKYHVHMLVWCEWHDTIESGILREKQLKRWKREWKVRLIEEANPEWRDLFKDFI